MTVAVNFQQATQRDAETWKFILSWKDLEFIEESKEWILHLNSAL